MSKVLLLIIFLRLHSRHSRKSKLLELPTTAATAKPASRTIFVFISTEFQERILPRTAFAAKSGRILPATRLVQRWTIVSVVVLSLPVIRGECSDAINRHLSV